MGFNIVHLVFFAILSSVAVKAQLLCPLGFSKFYLEDGRLKPTCLKFVEDYKTWNEHRVDCLAIGSQLMENVTSTLQIDIANYLVGLESTKLYHVGGTDLTLEGTWEWNSGLPMDVIWNPDEPDNGVDENCASLCYNLYFMCSMRCSALGGAICQTEVSEVSQTDPATDLPTSTPTDAVTSDANTDSPTTDTIIDSTASEPITDSSTAELSTDSPTSGPTPDSSTAEVSTDSPTSDLTPDSSTAEVSTDSPTSDQTFDSSTAEVSTDSPTSDLTPNSPTTDGLPDSTASDSITDSSTAEVSTNSPTSDLTPNSPTTDGLPDSTVSDTITDSSTAEVSTDSPTSDPTPNSPTTDGLTDTTDIASDSITDSSNGASTETDIPDTTTRTTTNNPMSSTIEAPYDVDCPTFYSKFYLDDERNYPTCLKLHDELQNWNTHRALCVDEDARLAQLTNPLQTQIIDYILTVPNFRDRSFFVGANDIRDEGVWLWNDEVTPVDVDWAPGYPADNGDCGCLCPISFLLCDCMCSLMEFGVCQHPGVRVPLV